MTVLKSDISVILSEVFCLRKDDSASASSVDASDQWPHRSSRLSPGEWLYGVYLSLRRHTKKTGGEWGRTQVAGWGRCPSGPNGPGRSDEVACRTRAPVFPRCDEVQPKQMKVNFQHLVQRPRICRKNQRNWFWLMRHSSLFMMTMFWVGAYVQLWWTCLSMKHGPKQK